MNGCGDGQSRTPLPGLTFGRLGGGGKLLTHPSRLRRESIIMRTRTTSLSMLAIAVSGLLTGCGLLDGDQTDATSAPPPRSSAPAPEGSGPPVAAEAGQGQMTRPGSRLKIGQRAIVPFSYGGKTGTIGITVTVIEPGNEALFAQRFGARAKGLTPYYLHYRIENVGGTDLSNSSAPLLKAVGPGGRGTGVGVIGTLPGCERGRAGATFTGAGATFETCRLQAARSGVPVTGAEYDDSTGGYRDQPIVWSR
jgi:hypothetical protein